MLTTPVPRCTFYPQQTFFICRLTAEEMFSFSNVHMMYMTHMRDEKCSFKNRFQSLVADFGCIQSRLRLYAAGRLSHVTEKRKNWNDEQEAILSPKQEGRPIRSLLVTFPLGAPSVINGSGVGGFIKTVYAAWGTQRSLSGLEMAAVFIAVYISPDASTPKDWCELISRSHSVPRLRKGSVR